ncbi:MAG TPA: hypothetical protein VFE78_24170 [Gemmataceae bacterium]|jgi:hypothetical protein|nr:hypothetical protein [Gemmataceae bacterium]
MDSREAARTLEVIRTLMERTCQYRLLTAWAGLAAGSLAGGGALLLCVLNPADPAAFAAVWGLVFAGSLLASFVGTVTRGRAVGERVWSRQARAVVLALVPALAAAAVLTVFFFARGEHLWLPGVWMLCYGQGALATAAYAPPPIRWLGAAMLPLGALTLTLGPAWAVAMMGLVFGLGHVGLGVVLLVAERRERRLRLHRQSVA